MNALNIFISTQKKVKLMNGKLKPEKKSFKTYLWLLFFIVIFFAMLTFFIIGLINLKIEYIFMGGTSTIGTAYILLITPYLQNPNNYELKIENENSFEGFHLYYKNKEVSIKYKVDKEGKFLFENNNNKLSTISYMDNTKMSNFTKYRIINYFSNWLKNKDFLSKEVTVTFEKI